MKIEEIRRKAESGPWALLARRLFAVLISAANTAILPNLISPRAYGLAAMSMVLLSLADMFKDFGLTSAMMRKGEVKPDEINFLFWFNICTTSILSAIVALSAPFIGYFFNEPSVTTIILYSLIGFIASGIALQYRGILARDLRFSSIALIDSITLLVQFSVTFILALIRHDVWALIFGTVASALVGSVLAITSSGWRPGIPKLIPETRELLRFGANTSIYTLSVFLSNNAVPVLFGRVLGTVVLGQYNRANAVLQIPLRNLVIPVAQGTMPILGRLRPYPEAYRDTYLAFLTRLNLLVIPMAIMIALCSGVALDALWGPEWATAADILQCMAPMAATYAYGYGIADLFVTQNRSRELRILGLIEMLVRVSAVSIGVCISAHWAALAFSWATVAVVILRVLVAGRKGPVTIADHIRAALPSLPPCLGTAVGCAIGLFVSSRNAFDSMQSTLIAVGLGCAFGGSAAIALTISRREIISLVKLFRIRRRGSAITSSSRAD